MDGWIDAGPPPAASFSLFLRRPTSLPGRVGGGGPVRWLLPFVALFLVVFFYIQGGSLLFLPDWPWRLLSGRKIVGLRCRLHQAQRAKSTSLFSTFFVRNHLVILSRERGWLCGMATQHRAFCAPTCQVFVTELTRVCTDSPISPSPVSPAVHTFLLYILHALLLLAGPLHVPECAVPRAEATVSPSAGEDRGGAAGEGVPGARGVHRRAQLPQLHAAPADLRRRSYGRCAQAYHFIRCRLPYIMR